MSRAQRLLDLIQILRNHRFPVTGAYLAGELNISLRTLYRDIASLQEQGAHIEGEAGLGYVLRSGYMLPPLMFSEEELEALVLGSRWVSKQGDPLLAEAAKQALSKISAVLPPGLQEELYDSGLLVGPAATLLPDEQIFLPQLREAIRRERKIVLGYQDQQGQVTDRTVWPFALGYMDRTRILAAWCELRQDFRHFRVDRIQTVEILVQHYPQRKAVLLQQWRQKEGISPA